MRYFYNAVFHICNCEFYKNYLQTFQSSLWSVTSVKAVVLTTFLLHTLKIKQNLVDYCVYMQRCSYVFLTTALYVDDLLIACSD